MDSFLLIYWIVYIYIKKKDMVYKQNIDSVNENLIQERDFLGNLYEKYQNIENPGNSFLPYIQKEVITGGSYLSLSNYIYSRS